MTDQNYSETNAEVTHEQTVIGHSHTLPITDLHPWDKNPRDIKEADFIRLKDQIQMLGQYKPLLVTPDGTVLGGNMRYRAYLEMGVDKVWVSTVEFHQDQEGRWRASVNGVPQAKVFQTQEDGMMEYALSDNDRAGYYDGDMLANLMPNLNVDWNKYAIDLNAPLNVKELLEKIAPEEPIEEEATKASEDKTMDVVCPDCGKSFNVKIPNA